MSKMIGTIKIRKPIFFSNIILFIILSLATFSCGFHLVKNPGPQVSYSVDEAREKNTYICSYKLKKSALNGIKISSIFAEKKHSHDGGFFSKFNIDEHEAQLVIVTADCLACDGKGFDIDWSISKFHLRSGYNIIRDYNVKELPDTISFSILSVKDRKVVKADTLFRL